MTADLERTETLVAQTLTRRAQEAPPDGPLLTDVHARLRRRRTTRTVAAAVLASSSVVAGVLGVTSLVRNEPAPNAPAAADTWRWESYRGIEVQVPSSWRQGGDGSDACLGRKAQPTVARSPVIRTAQYCGEVAPLAFRADTLKFDTVGKPGIRRWDNGWADQTRVVSGVSVTVFSADPALRSRILNSARLVAGTDTYGCRPDHPAAANPRMRPEPTGGIDSVGEVTGLSICSYLPRTADRNEPPLLFAARALTGADADGLVEAIRAAPEGRGPGNSPACSYVGFKLFVLVVHGSARDQDVVVRFSGDCGNGIDDGQVEHRLTSEVLRPILTGPDASWSASDEVGQLIAPHPTKDPTR
jgi:hypothetical protein